MSQQFCKRGRGYLIPQDDQLPRHCFQSFVFSLLFCSNFFYSLSFSFFGEKTDGNQGGEGEDWRIDIWRGFFILYSKLHHHHPSSSFSVVAGSCFYPELSFAADKDRVKQIFMRACFCGKLHRSQRFGMLKKCRRGQRKTGGVERMKELILCAI